MLNIKIHNEKGITIVEALIASFLTFIAIAWLMPMQSTSLNTGFRADYLGRATYIMQTELETREYEIMNPNIPVAVGTFPKTVTASGSAGGPEGDAVFDVVTTITPVAGTTNSWLVNVRVRWTRGPANGITSSIIATRHFNF